MSPDRPKPDWSAGYWKDMLIYQRKQMIRDDSFKMIITWLEFKPGLDVVDIGCGLGYLGYTFWPFFGEGGRYTGIDLNDRLIKEAEQKARDWAKGGQVSFRVGDAGRLPLPDNSSDIVMCQTLLMHLERPQQALAEMVRVTRPGGLLVCLEPDNHNPTLGELFNSMPERSIEEHLLHVKVQLISHRGRIKLGNGDRSIGVKVPHLMKEVGLVDIDVRTNDRTHYIEPPYEDMLQKRSLEHLKKYLLDDDNRANLIAREREEFLAGGGDLTEYEKYRSMSDKYL
ncbi:MAG: methyltransferase domain-containing protein, partial [candidate division Zixibacteria bacterium]|nr:methyltransferase domain-containing protein [candidate division Zixibacteria bacterium]